MAEVLRADLENENNTIRAYRERMRQCEMMQEYAVAEDIREILRQEQAHSTLHFGCHAILAGIILLQGSVRGRPTPACFTFWSGANFHG